MRSYRCPLDPDDLEGELNLGIMLAADTVRMDIGDPMEYLISRGFNHVRRRVRAECNREIIEECMGCHKLRPHRWGPCTKCGLKDFMLHRRATMLPEGDEPCAKPLVEAVEAGV